MSETRRIGPYVAIVAVGVFVAVAGALLLSDRTPAVLNLVGDAVIDIGRAVESRFGIDWFDRSDIPGRRDQIGHAALWGFGMVVVGIALWRPVPIPITAVILAGISLLSEYGQDALSATRAADIDDATANIIGIACVAVPLAVIQLAHHAWTRRHPRAVTVHPVTESGAYWEPQVDQPYTYRPAAETLIPDRPEPIVPDPDLVATPQPRPARALVARYDTPATQETPNVQAPIAP